MGQAKRNGRNTVANGDKFVSIMKWISCIYLLYVTVVFLLVCPTGYVDYDISKRNMFIIPTLIFGLAEILIWLISLDKEHHIVLGYKNKKDKVDFAMYALMLVWIISTIASDDKNFAFWGDEYRYEGFIFFASALLAMFLISHIGGWNKLNTVAVMAVLPILYIWQIMNYFGVDPLNWQMDRQYVLLEASLANIDQNSAFDGIAIMATSCAFVLCKKKISKVILAITNILCVAAAISTMSDSFYFGLALGAVILIGYTLKHKEYIRSTALVMLQYWLGIVLIRIMNDTWISHTYYNIFMDGSSGCAIICSDLVIKALAALVIVFGIIAVFYPKLPDRLTNVLHAVYACLLGGGSVIAVIILTVLYASGSQGTIATFMRSVLATRMPIWQYSVRNIGFQDMFHKLFGIGFGNYNRVMDRYSAEIYTVRDYSELADAHNIFMDMLVLTGIIGLTVFLVLLISLIVKFRRAAGKYPWALIGLMLVGGDMITGLVNTNHIVVTPWVYIGIGVVLFRVALNEKEETDDLPWAEVEATAENSTDRMSENISRSTPDIPEKAIDNRPKNAAGNSADNRLENATGNSSDNRPEDVAGNLSDNRPENAAGNSADNKKEKSSEKSLQSKKSSKKNRRKK